MRYIIVFALLLCSSTTFAQVDSNEFGKYKLTQYIGLRSETGWNKAWYKSLGISYLNANANMHLPYSFVAYAAVDINLATYNNPSTVFYSYKAGIEYSNALLMYGFEVKGLTDFKGKEHGIFTPKAGLTIFGYANLTYGYNIFQKEFNVFGIGKHQIAFSMNLSKKLFTESFVPE